MKNTQKWIFGENVQTSLALNFLVRYNYRNQTWHGFSYPKRHDFAVIIALGGSGPVVSL